MICSDPHHWISGRAIDERSVDCYFLHLWWGRWNQRNCLNHWALDIRCKVSLWFIRIIAWGEPIGTYSSYQRSISNIITNQLKKSIRHPCNITHSRSPRRMYGPMDMYLHMCKLRSQSITYRAIYHTIYKVKVAIAFLSTKREQRRSIIHGLFYQKKKLHGLHMLHIQINVFASIRSACPCKATGTNFILGWC